jgi:tocopherol O-methyltransferase
MVTSFGKNLSSESIHEKVSQFYDLGSPLYLEVYGPHIHDGYYITGRENKLAAQENLTRLLAEKAGIKKGTHVLDVGCGVGGSSVWMAENLGATTVGITISPVQLEIARQTAEDRKVNSAFQLMNAEAMHFEEQFDVIWVLAAMTHFRDQPAFIALATKYLKKGGRFVVFDWLLDERVTDPLEDRYVKPVAEGMLLSSLYPLNAYLKWFIEDGYRITYAEDVTDRTIKTWDVALSIIKKPAVLKMASRITREQVAEVLKFFKSIRDMKTAMKKEKIISGIVVAEKL